MCMFVEVKIASLFFIKRFIVCDVNATFVGTIEEIHDSTEIVIASESENSKLMGPVEVA